MLQALRLKYSTFLAVIIVAILACTLIPTSFAQKNLDTAINFFDNTITETANPDARQGINPYQAFYNEYIASSFSSDTSGGEFALTRFAFIIADLLRYIFTILAVVFIVLAGMRMTGDNEEESKKQLTKIRDVVGGVIIMNVAAEVVKRVFGTDSVPDRINTTDYLSRFWGENASKAIPFQLSEQVILPLMEFILSFLAAFCIMFIVISAFRIITSQGEEDAIKSAQKVVLNNAIGLGVIVFAKAFVSAVYGIPLGDSVSDAPGDITPQLASGIDTLMSISNYLLGFMTIGAVVFFIYAGILIIFGGVNEEQKKRGYTIAKYTFYALILAISSYAIVSTFIRLMV